MIGSERTNTPALQDQGNDRQTRIRQLNDELRRYGRGGIVMLSAGIATLTIDAVREIMDEVRCFEDFSADNDPYGEHDLGIFRHKGERIMWKIDYYDTDRRYGSPDPSDSKVTARVLTIMYASEY